MYLTKITALACIVLTAAACGDTEETTTMDHSQHDMGGDHQPTDAPTAHPLAHLVEGTYAIKMVIPKLQNLPVIGETESAVLSYSLGTIKQQGHSFTITEQPCHYVASTNELIQVSIPDRIPAAITPTVTPITFQGEGDNISYDRAESVVVVGANLADPANDPLPTSPDDDRVVDHEGDGKPGATAMISGMISGELYYVQRQHYAYSGTRAADGTLSGLLLDRSQQNTIDATEDMLKSDTSSTPIPERTTATLLPLTGDYTCSQLIYELPTLFPERADQ